MSEKENKTITSLNTLKNWFKTGLKPTQAQFWAWLDSFWHKDEEIPQEKITGLAETLENKAETSDLEIKANADASGLSEEQKQAWKEALEVGELPTNIALVDESGDDGNKLGNVYTKTKSDELLREKLDKPTQTATTTEAPFVVGVNENNESYKLPAGDLGKNIANSHLTSQEGAGLTLGADLSIDANGHKFKINNLINADNDITFTKQPVLREDGTMGSIPIQPILSVHIPQQQTITVNHIYPSSIPEPPVWADDIKSVMTEYKSMEFTPVTSDDFVGVVSVGTDGMINSSTNTIINSSLIFPSNRDWIIKFKVNSMLGRVGISQETNYSPEIGFGLIGGFGPDYGGFGMLQGSRINPHRTAGDGIGLIIKKGDFIACIGYSKNKTGYQVYNGNWDFGDYRLALHRFSASISYKFLN